MYIEINIKEKTNSVYFV